MKKKLIEYVRHEGRLVGVVVALDRDQIGWSQCSPKDKFVKSRGIKIAEGRAEYGTNKLPVKYKVEEFRDRVTPIRDRGYDYMYGFCKGTRDLVNETIERMKERAVRYYK